jgi:hypothetical protein
MVMTAPDGTWQDPMDVQLAMKPEIRPPGKRGTRRQGHRIEKAGSDGPNRLFPE